MNNQCAECKIRKFCYREEPKDDWTCDSYKADDDYVDFFWTRTEQKKRNRSYMDIEQLLSKR